MLLVMMRSCRGSSAVYGLCGGRKNCLEVVVEHGEFEPSGVSQLIGSGVSGSVNGIDER